jgi:hypothetical protein
VRGDFLLCQVLIRRKFDSHGRENNNMLQFVLRASCREVQSEELTNRSGNHFTILVNEPVGSVIVILIHVVYLPYMLWYVGTVVVQCSLND